jgi:phage terminase large subunit
MDTIDAACRQKLPHGRYAYVAPFLAQAKEVAWEYLKRFARPILADKNESELWVELVNGARIRIHGADNPDRLRGSYLDGVVLDEYADMRPGVWGEVIRPMLADRSGWAVFIGTPKGRNEFFDIYDRAERTPDWFALTLRASETGILSASELEDAQLDMTPEQFAQEFECSFEAAILGAYYGKEMAEVERSGRILDLPVDINAPVHVAWDLGVGDATALWFFQMVGPEVHVIDHYEATGYAINHYAEVIKAKPYPRGTDYVPHDALQRSFTSAGPDGKARQRLEVMLECGLSPVVVAQHTLEDGISAVRQTLPRCRFDAVRCRDGLEALRQYRTDYDEKAKVFRDKPLHNWASHSADAFRYLAVAWQEVAKAAPPPKPQHAFVAQPDGTIRSTLNVNDLIKRNAKLRKQRGR